MRVVVWSTRLGECFQDVADCEAVLQEWFASPMDAMIEGKQEVDQVLIDRLHTVLRPFLLRRLKRDVERQLPDKHEHVVLCRLSKRQRGLYEEFLASRRVRDTLEGGNVVGVMNILMQLRKVSSPAVRPSRIAHRAL
jgi:SNF2 family DNA or RNA helicase